MRRAVLFDFGGTLDTDGVHWSEKFWDFYEKFRIGVPKAQFENAFVRSEEELLRDSGLPGLTFHQTLGKQFAIQFQILKLSITPSRRQEIADACFEDVRLTIERAKSIIKQYQPTYRFGIVSNFYGNLGIVCREFGLDALIDVMVDSAVVGVRKPDPAIFRIALEELRAEPHETVVVGDSYERDIVPSKQIGCSTVWLKGRSWTQHPAVTPAADYTVSSLSELRNIL
jgi:HAD superfamily hydrolase (TIGR01549 family)